MNKLSVSIIFALYLVGCLESPGNGIESVGVPTLDLNCFQAQSFDCVSANNGKTAYVGLISDTGTNCSSYLFQIAFASDFGSYFDLSGNTAMSFTSSLVGQITSWKNSQGSAVASMFNLTYKACAFIDTDGNGLLSAGETLGEALIAPDDNTPIITDWF